ncbi:MAG: hypothetical protein ABIJ75_07950 [Actinomycetota bacterium]
MEDTLEVGALRCIDRDGSIVIMGGIDERGHCVTFAADCRMAQHIMAAAEAGEDPTALVPAYAILRDSGPAFEVIS